MYIADSKRSEGSIHWKHYLHRNEVPLFQQQKAKNKTKHSLMWFSNSKSGGFTLDAFYLHNLIGQIYPAAAEKKWTWVSEERLFGHNMYTHNIPTVTGANNDLLTSLCETTKGIKRWGRRRWWVAPFVLRVFLHIQQVIDYWRNKKSAASAKISSMQTTRWLKSCTWNRTYAGHHFVFSLCAVQVLHGTRLSKVLFWSIYIFTFLNVS